MSQHLVEERKHRINMMRLILRDYTISAIRNYGLDENNRIGKEWFGINKKQLIADYCLEEGTRTTRAEEYLKLFMDSGKYYDDGGYLKPSDETIKECIKLMERNKMLIPNAEPTTLTQTE